MLAELGPHANTAFAERLCKILGGAERACEKPGCASGSEGKLKICTGCRGVWYCSRECQREHWAAHKHACSKRVSIRNVVLRWRPLI